MRAIFHTTTAVMLLALGIVSAGAQEPMPWQPNLEAAQRLAAQTNRLVLIHFWAPWCRPCMRMEQEVFSKVETAKGLEANFVLVKLNADEAPGTARLYGVSSLPSDVITTPSGRLVSQIQSPPTATQYVTQMNQAAAGYRSLARKVSDNTAPAPAVTTDVPPGAIAPPTSPSTDPSASPPANTTASPTAPPATSSPVAAANDRYAEYFPGGQSTSPAPETSPVTPAQAYTNVPAATPVAQGAPLTDPYAHPSAPQAAMQPPVPDAHPMQAPAAVNPYASNPYTAAPPAASPAAPNPYAAPAPQVQTAVPANPAAAPPSYVSQASVAPQVQLPPLPPGCPPLALDGNCPVTLVERKRWAVGHPTFGAVHRGRTYLFLGPQERDKFLADPDRFSPVLSGLDPVMAIDGKVSAPGKREFGVFGADGKIYLFADEASRARFEQNEQHYTAAITQAAQQPTYQAMRPSP